MKYKSSNWTKIQSNSQMLKHQHNKWYSHVKYKTTMSIGLTTCNRVKKFYEHASVMVKAILLTTRKHENWKEIWWLWAKEWKKTNAT